MPWLPRSHGLCVTQIWHFLGWRGGGAHDSVTGKTGGRHRHARSPGDGDPAGPAPPPALTHAVAVMTPLTHLAQKPKNQLCNRRLPWAPRLVPGRKDFTPRLSLAPIPRSAPHHRSGPGPRPAPREGTSRLRSATGLTPTVLSLNSNLRDLPQHEPSPALPGLSVARAAALNPGARSHVDAMHTPHAYAHVFRPRFG